MLIVLLHKIIKEKGFISTNVLVEPQGIIENNEELKTLLPIIYLDELLYSIFY